MKITDVETHVVSVPFHAPIRVSIGVAKGATRTVLKVHTDEDIVGLGETLGSSAKPYIDSVLRPKLIGSSPHEVEKIVMKCTGYTRYQPFLSINMRPISGVEIALWDIIGKDAGRPVCDLLGGRYRERVSFSGYVYPRLRNGRIGGESTPEEIAKYCEGIVKKNGNSRLEVKLGVFTPDVDIKIVEAMRDAVGPDIEIGIDPNSVWSPETAQKVIRRMERFDLCNVEEPCRGLIASARVRSRIETPISTHCPWIPEVARLEAADVIVGDPYEVGGILASKKLIAAAEQHNLGFWIHSAAELGISQAANLHIAASSPHIVHPSQGTYEHLTDDIIRGGLLGIENGCMDVPRGEGLGVEVDGKRLEKYSRLFEEKGEFGFPGYGAEDYDPSRPGWFPEFPTY